MASALIGAKFRAWANDGTPLAFGKVYTYKTGTTVPKVTYTTEAQTTPNANPVILNASGYADIYLDGSYKIVVKDAYDVEIHTTDPVSDPSNVGASATLRNADTIQDLLAINPAVISSVLVIDYHGDVTGGGGNFVWDATAVKNTHNGGTIIDPDVTYPTNWTNQAQLAVWFNGSANVTTGCWIRKLEGDINPRMFGAKGDGVTDDSAAIGDAIAAVITAGGGILYFPAGKYKCLGRIGTFINVKNLTLLGYGAEIQNFAGTNVQGLMQFGNAATDGNGMYSASAITVNHLNILGLKFTSSGIFNSGTNRWVDQMPISVNTAKDVLVRDCYFEDWDFAAIDFGAICKDALVDACSFYSSRVDAGQANYGVRAFCYANYTNYKNGNGDLSPTNPVTGILKAGYTYIPDTSTTWGHEGISVTNCYFENVSHGVMVSSARRGVVANNRFVNMSTRSVSLTTYSTDYLCSNNTHSLDTTQQTSTGVSVFYGLGQGTFRHQIQGEKFSVVGDTNNATGFGPIKVYYNSHDWLIADCRFDIPLWAGSGGRCINVEDNADGEVRNNHFKCPNVAHPVTFLPAYTVTAPGYQQRKIWVIGNIFESFADGAIQILSSTSAPEPIVIKDNVVHGDPTRFVACQFPNVGQVAKLDLSGNKFLGNPVRYIDNVAANKAILLSTDVLEIESFLSTGGGVVNPSTTAVSFDFGSYSLPACFTNGQKMYDFTTYGNRANGQASTDFYFAITGETATTVSGNIVRNAGASFQIGQVALTVRFLPLNT